MTRSQFRLDQPRANDLVGDPVLLAGMGGGFEATLDVRVLGAAGQVVVETFAVSSNLISAWQSSVLLPESFSDTRGVVEVGPSTGADDPQPRVSVPVFFGSRIVADYRSYVLHVVRSGETLSGIAASTPLYSGSGFQGIFEANADILSDPDLIHPGQVLRIPSNF